MIMWLKSALVSIGLLACAAIHFFKPESKQEEMVDKIVETVVQNSTGVDIHATQEAIDDIQDSLR